MLIGVQCLASHMVSRALLRLTPECRDRSKPCVLLSELPQNKLNKMKSAFHLLQGSKNSCKSCPSLSPLFFVFGSKSEKPRMVPWGVSRCVSTVSWKYHWWPLGLTLVRFVVAYASTASCYAKPCSWHHHNRKAESLVTSRQLPALP